MRNGLANLGGEFWAWTFGGLPQWLINPGLYMRWSRRVVIETRSIDSEEVRSGAVVDIVLAPNLLLQKDLTFPIAVKSNLDSAINLNMRQTLPAGGSNLLWRYCVLRRENSNLIVRVYLLKKSLLEALRKEVTSKGASLRSVSVAKHPSVLLFWTDRRRIDRSRRIWGTMAAAMVLGLVGYVAWHEAEETTDLAARVFHLRTEKTALAARAVELRSQFNSDRISFATISSDLNVFLGEFHRLPVLLGLTEALSDDTWISEFDLNGPRLNLSGFSSREVTEVMATIRALPTVQWVDLNGPVTFDRVSRRNRFDLTVSLQQPSGATP